MLIFRYLKKEVVVTLCALTVILLLIFMSNQVVIYLNRAASGAIPGVLIMQLMLLELPNLLSLLLPLGFYIALLLSYGRMYADNEMVVLQASGYGEMQLLKHSMLMAAVVALVTASMILLSPTIAYERAKLLQATGVKPFIQTIVPGRFRDFSNGQYVFYVEKIPTDHQSAEGIFFARYLAVAGRPKWDILWADHASIHFNKQTKQEEVILTNGKKYQGLPGEAAYQIAEFASYQMTIPHPTINIRNDIRTVPLKNLWYAKDQLPNFAELEWRASIPLMVLVLTLIAVPLSRVNPRAGKYARLLPAIILYMIYANGMFICRDALASGKLSIWIGMIGLHFFMASIGVVLLWRK